MKFQIVQPSASLKNFIRYYCFMESGPHDRDVVERVIPLEHIQLMFHYKNPFVVLKQDKPAVLQPRSLISGLSDSFTDVSTNGETGVVFISFYPAGACHFFDFPLSAIENQSVDMKDIFNYEVRHVEESLNDSFTIPDKVQVLEHYLLARYAPIPVYDRLLIGKGLDIIKCSKGQTSAKSLSGILHTSPKTLERKFSHYLGKTTKQLIKLTRFQEVLRDFSSLKTRTLTEHAYHNGYFDQAHFIHDFKAYTGYTPGEFLQKYPDFNIYAETC